MIELYAVAPILSAKREVSIITIGKKEIPTSFKLNLC